VKPNSSPNELTGSLESLVSLLEEVLTWPGPTLFRKYQWGGVQTLEGILKRRSIRLFHDIVADLDDVVGADA